MSVDRRKEVDMIVIGAGISGVATAKCAKDAGLSVVVLERTSEVGGLWKFRENDYGVMRFTHINVSKYNYCFSDFPFSDDTPDYPHNTHMAEYIADYVEHFELGPLILFNRKVLSIEQDSDGWTVKVKQTEEDGQTRAPAVDRQWRQMRKFRKNSTKNEALVNVLTTREAVQTLIESLDTEVHKAKYIAIATGHHAKPSIPKFLGQESFRGEIIHSVKFNDALTNGMTGKRVLVVGIGNSAVDAAVNCASIGRCKSVYISTRSGAWVVPNYIFGHPTDLYACRLFFMLPWTLANFIFEKVICVVSGNPKRWKLNPRMQALQTQPTVSPTLIHHIQRHDIKIVPNIQKIDGQKVIFMNGESAEFDHIILCTGYKIDLPFLEERVRSRVLDPETNKIQLFKNVFSPEIGPSLAFIGFVQPASGGVLTMSEMQARWLAEVCKGKVTLPSTDEQVKSIAEEEKQQHTRYYQSARHTIQKDPIVYNDELASFIGAKPNPLMFPDLAWRLLLGSCGAYQWRLQGPNSWDGAKRAVRKVPLTELMHYSGLLVVTVLFLLVFYLYRFLF